MQRTTGQEREIWRGSRLALKLVALGHLPAVQESFQVPELKDTWGSAWGSRGHGLEEGQNARVPRSRRNGHGEKKEERKDKVAPVSHFWFRAVVPEKPYWPSVCKHAQMRLFRWMSLPEQKESGGGGGEYLHSCNQSCCYTVHSSSKPDLSPYGVFCCALGIKWE